MGTSDELRAQAAEIWEAQHAHPFVTAIGDGTLDVEQFGFWLRQDYLFLVEYGRVLALAAARSPDLATMRRFAELAHETLASEMDLHRSYCAKLGISVETLESEQMAPTTQAYTDFLVRTAALGDFSELVAALLPCMWGYSEVGRRLVERGRGADRRYGAWIDMYASDAFADLARWCRGLVDVVGEGVGAQARGAMSRAFLTSSRYELAFWGMALKTRSR
ncbi:MAG: thiaminase II [Actinobacteria bacterium]|nr:thiaminase II [Actinomycetota bacterium]